MRFLKDGQTGWLRTEDLVVGDVLKTADGTLPVSSLRYVAEPVMTVYLETEAGNFLVAGHNDL